MQLNKTHKRTIVRQIMNDVPQIDYAALINGYVQAEAVKLFPPAVKALYDDPKMRCYLSSAQLSCSGTHLYSVGTIFWPDRSDCAPSYVQTVYLAKRHYNSENDKRTLKLIDACRVQVDEYIRLSDKQRKDRESLEHRLTTMLDGIRTLKQAKTLLEPELHKYLPEEPPKADQKAAQASTALVPYVVAHLKEMGWPKDKEAA